MSAYDYVLAVDGGATGGTVTLTSAPFDILEYQPRTAPIGDVSLEETIAFRLTDGSTSNNLAEVRALANLMRQARDAQVDRAIEKVYLTWKESSGGTVWRSEIKDGRPEWDAGALNWTYWSGDTQFANLYFQRVNYWEGPETPVRMSNGWGTNALDLDVSNHNAGTVNNWVAIAGTAIIGDLPGATRLSIGNATSPDAWGLATVWVGQNWGNPSLFSPVLEAESGVYTGGSAVADASYSGGTAIVRSLASSPTPSVIDAIVIPSWVTSAAKGMYVKAMARFTADPSPDVRYRIDLYNGAQPIWEGPLVSIDPTIEEVIRDLGTFRLPPWLGGMNDIKELTLRLNAVQTTTSTQNIHLDFIYLLPVHGYRELRLIGPLMAGIMVDDGLDDRLYHDLGTGIDKVGAVVGTGARIMLKPGVNQRLYFLSHSGAANTAEIDRKLAINLYYRPRRLTL